jgi:uncharacterized protein with GYD domain
VANPHHDLRLHPLIVTKLKFEQLFLTMGIYDLVAILDAPDQQSIAKFVLGVGSTGNVRTVTLPAFAEAEHRSLIGSL